MSNERNFLWVTLEEPAEEDTLHLQVGFSGNTIYLEADGTFEAGNTEPSVNIDLFSNTIVMFLDGAQATQATPDH